MEAERDLTRPKCLTVRAAYRSKPYAVPHVGMFGCMPEKKTLERARKDKQEEKAPSTQAGEFVREEMDHIREGKHGARSSAQAIAIGLSKARRAGGWRRLSLEKPRKRLESRPNASWRRGRAGRRELRPSGRRRLPRRCNVKGTRPRRRRLCRSMLRLPPRHAGWAGSTG